jgi:hypothetical protein
MFGSKKRRLDAIRQRALEADARVAERMKQVANTGYVSFDGVAPPPPKPTRTGGPGQTYEGRKVEIREAITRWNDLEIAIWRTGPATMCMVKVRGDRPFVLGSSVCHPSDVFVQEIGEKMAMGRALRQLGQNYLDECEGQWVPEITRAGF